jgi:hypothetical protein
MRVPGFMAREGGLVSLHLLTAAFGGVLVILVPSE